MNTLSMPNHFEPREPSRRVTGLVVVLTLHALLGYALVSGMARKGLNLIKEPLEAVIIQEVLLPPPPPPPPVKFIKTAEPQAPRADSAPPIQRSDSLPVPSVSPVELPPSEVQAPMKPTLPVVAAPAAEPDHQKAQVASMENEYASWVRAMLNSIKRFPTGRAASQQRPQGKVKVWFTLARAGSLIEAGILESSNSNLLDNAALATVRRDVYSWDASQPDGAAPSSGQRVVPGSMKLHGIPIEMDKTYRITVNNFMASGGDNFTVLQQGRNVQAGEIDSVVAKLYFRAKGIVKTPTLDRISRVN